MPPENKRKLWEERLDAALGVAASAILFALMLITFGVMISWTFMDRRHLRHFAGFSEAYRKARTSVARHVLYTGERVPCAALRRGVRRRGVHRSILLHRQA